jgi:two-component system phosphate regulon sensor histidine kinase PhoR
MMWLSGFALATISIAIVVYYFCERIRWKRVFAECCKISCGDSPEFTRNGWSNPQDGILALCEKITEERDRLRQQINEDAFNLDAILSSMTEGVMVVDRDRRIQLVNKSFNELFNLNSNPVGKTILMSLRQAAIEDVVRLTIDTSLMQSREIILPGQSEAATRYFEINAVPVPDRLGQTTGAVTVLHEITELRHVEMIRREFVSNVSHELRTPLSIFHGYLENLIDDPELPRAEIANALRVMRRHSQRLNALLEDLLTLARLESRRVKIEPVLIRVVPFLQKMVEEWTPAIVEKKRTIRYEGDDEVPPINGDMMRMEQVLNNLIDNSLKYTSKGGEITVGARLLEREVEIFVSDNGIGIPPSDLPHVFERFYRVDKARSREAGGTGLGLSIVKHIVALHGGTVHAHSEYSKGTRISMRFNADEDEEW